MKMKSPDGKSRLASKRIMKTCKECNKQVPTACKGCPCGYHFRKTLFSETHSEPASNAGSTDSSGDAALSRRTQRTRRARPHFFDSLEYGTHVRRQSKGQGIEGGGNKLPGWAKATTAGAAKSKVKASNKPKIGVSSGSSVKKGTLTSNGSANDVAAIVGTVCDVTVSTKDGTTTAAAAAGGGGSSSSCSSRDEDIHGVMTADKAIHYSIILAEINRKYSSVTFRPA